MGRSTGHPRSLSTGADSREVGLTLLRLWTDLVLRGVVCPITSLMRLGEPALGLRGAGRATAARKQQEP